MVVGAHDTRTVSVIIRNRNEAETLRQIFAALDQQTLDHEVVVVDNESTDGSVELATSRGATVVSIATVDFSYGGSLNRGMEATTHDHVVVLSGHSIPVGPRFLEDATAPMADPTVAAVRLLRADKAPELADWPGRTPIGAGDVGAMVKRGPIASGCVFRRSVWEQIPFDDSLDSDEDKAWGVAAAQAGYVVAPAPAVYVYHRALGLVDALQRESRSAMGVYRATGHRPRVGLGTTVRQLVSGVGAAVLAPLWRWFDSVSIPLRSRRPARRGALWRAPDPQS